MKFNLVGKYLDVYGIGGIYPAKIESFQWSKNSDGSYRFYVGEPYTIFYLMLTLGCVEQISPLDEDGNIIPR